MTKYAQARQNMVDCQIRTNKVTDERLLEAMLKIPREAFVPDHIKGVAYVDEDIDLGNGRFMQEPMVLARLIQEASVGAEDIVLDIGCGTGYSTAVIAQLASTVVGIEEDNDLAVKAEERLKDLDITNAVTFQGQLTEGYAEQAPYDVIFINGAVPTVPEGLFDQLAENGRLLTVLSDDGHSGSAVVYKRVRDVIVEKIIFDAATPILNAFLPKDDFVF